MKYEPCSIVSGTHRVVKYNRRLYIACDETLVYTPPDFLRLQSRELLQQLADNANARGQLHIDDVILFETICPRASFARKRSK